MHLSCAHHGLVELAAKSAITLLRYSDVIPIDKLYYQAGMACKAFNSEQNLAFFLLSRYIDLSDAIADGSDAMLENSAFQDCDNIPADFQLPQTQYIADEVRQTQVPQSNVVLTLSLSLDVIGVRAGHPRGRARLGIGNVHFVGH
jgi:intraflagellar transport protein 172